MEEKIENLIRQNEELRNANNTYRIVNDELRNQINMLNHIIEKIFEYNNKEENNGKN